MMRVLQNFVKKHREMLIITLVYLLCIMYLLPLRDVGFDDDFAYIKTVENYARTNQLRILDWTAVTMVFQAIWGKFFYNAFGHSIKSLHFASLSILYFGLVYFYYLLRELGIDAKKSLVATLALLAFPFTLQYSFSFMSDVYYISLSIITIYYYLRSFKSNSLLYPILGSTFAGFTFLTRQIGAVYPISFVLVFAYKFIQTRKINLKLVLAGLSPFLLAAYGYSIWIKEVGITVSQQLAVKEPARRTIEHVFFNFLNPNKAPTINRDIFEGIIQRSNGYLFILIGFLSLYVFMFKLHSKNVKLYIKNNWGWIKGSFFLFCLFLISDYIMGGKFIKLPPNSFLLNYSSIIDWYKVWPVLVYASLPIWILIIAHAMKTIFYIFFVQRKKPYYRLRRFLIFLFIFIYSLYFLRVVQANNPYIFKMEIIYGEFDAKRVDLFLINSPLYLFTLIDGNLHLVPEILKESWFYFLIQIIGVLLPIYVLTSHKLRVVSVEKLSSVFLVLCFLGKLFATLILANYFWINYINQFAFLAIIFLIYITRNIEIKKKYAFLILLVFFGISLQLVRNRYQKDGAKWEMATRLVDKGVKPISIESVNWAWYPYWYFEESFNEQVKLAGGDKYSIPFTKLGSWPNKPLEDGPYYAFTFNIPDMYEEKLIYYDYFFRPSNLYLVKTR